MQQILNKLSEIETTARRIMEDADRTKAALSSEMEQQCRDFDAALEQETNKKIQELRNSLEEQKDQELHFSDKKQRRLLTIWMLITDKTTKSSRKNYSTGSLNPERSDAIWEISFLTAESLPRSVPCRAS